MKSRLAGSAGLQAGCRGGLWPALIAAGVDAARTAGLEASATHFDGATSAWALTRGIDWEDLQKTG